MSKRIFTKEQINELLQNPNVARCSEKSITYHKDFKVRAIKQYREEGLPAREIFVQAGFNESVIGRDTPKESLGRWLKVLRLKGAGQLSVETRGRGGGRPKTNWSSEKEKLKYLETQVAYLKAENAFLAKLRKKRLN
jgi:transposase